MAHYIAAECPHRRPPPTFELQSHSTHSDGELSPAGVVAAPPAKPASSCFALTDHDSVDGVAEAAAPRRSWGCGSSPGVEISVLDPGATDLHLCGYLIDPAERARCSPSCSARARTASTARSG